MSIRITSTLFLLCFASAGITHAGNLVPPTVATADKPLALKPAPRDAKWWTQRHDKKLADLKKQGKVDLLMIGDSITHGWEGRGKKVWQTFYAKRNAFNIGYSGDRTEHVLWRIDHGEVDGIAPKLAVIMIGTNNTGHRKDPADQTAAGIKAIVQKLGKKLPNTKILLLGIFPRAAKTDHPQRQLNDAINAQISKLNDGKRVFYLNINEKFLTKDGVLEKSVMPDLLHPHEAGYEIWAKAMEPMIAKLMK